MKVVIDAFVPSCGEMLWSDLFTYVNEWFCFLALFESALVTFITYYKEDTLLPEWLLVLCGCGQAMHKHKPFDDSETIKTTAQKMGVLEPGKLGGISKMDDGLSAFAPVSHRSLAKPLFRALNDQHPERNEQPARLPSPSAPPDRSAPHPHTTSGGNGRRACGRPACAGRGAPS